MESDVKSESAKFATADHQEKTSTRDWPRLLRSYIESRNWTQSQLAEKLGTHVSSVNRWLLGYSVPSVTYRKILLDMFQGRKFGRCDLLKISIQRSPNVELLFDEQYRVVMASDVWLNLLRLDQSDVVGQPFGRYMTETIERNMREIGGPMRWFSSGVLLMESINVRKARENANNAEDLMFQSTCTTVSDGREGPCLRLVSSALIDPRRFQCKRPFIQLMDDAES